MKTSTHIKLNDNFIRMDRAFYNNTIPFSSYIVRTRTYQKGFKGIPNMYTMCININNSIFK